MHIGAVAVIAQFDDLPGIVQGYTFNGEQRAAVIDMQQAAFITNRAPGTNLLVCNL